VAPTHWARGTGLVASRELCFLRGWSQVLVLREVKSALSLGWLWPGLSWCRRQSVSWSQGPRGSYAWLCNLGFSFHV
jgi:hypothetical protein